jgi:hypothetical protein
VAGKTGAVTLVVDDVSGAAPLASPALTGNVTITSNTSGAALFIEQSGTGNILTLHDQASDSTFVAIDQNGKVNTIASTTTNAGLNIPHGAAPTTPVNGDVWTTTAGLFARVNGGTQQYAPLGSNNTFSNANSTFGSSTATGTINLASGATISGSTKTVNIGTGGVAGSTTNIAIGATAGTSTTTLNGTINATTASPGTNTTQIATTAFVTAAVAAGSGATWGSITGTLSSQTDLQTALNAKLDSTTAASTYYLQTNPSGYLTSTTAGALYYPLSSNPAGYLTSAPVTSVAGKTGAVTLVNTDISGLGTMATANTADYSTTTVANGLYYPLSSNPAGYITSAPVTSVAGKTGAVTLVVGDVSGAAPTASPTLTGTPLSTTAAADTNTTQIATTAFVVGQAGSTTPAANGTAAIGTSLRYARADHVHPSDNNVKAWISFNGTGTPAIRGSFNVTSITDNGAGDYTINFTNAISDANYATVVTCMRVSGNTGAMGFIRETTTPTTGLVRIGTTNQGGTAVDPLYVTVAILR